MSIEMGKYDKGHETTIEKAKKNKSERTRVPWVKKSVRLTFCWKIFWLD